MSLYVQHHVSAFWDGLLSSSLSGGSGSGSGSGRGSMMIFQLNLHLVCSQITKSYSGRGVSNQGKVSSHLTHS